MISPPDRWRRPAAAVLIAGGLLLVVPLAARAAPEVVAQRGLPSSLSARYGSAVPIGDPSVAGPYAVPTGSGLEIRDSGLGGDSPIGVFRTPGAIDALSLDGSTAYLFAGEAGIVAVDLSNPASPSAIGSFTGLGKVTLGAASSDGYGLVAASDLGLHFMGRSGPGAMSLLETRDYPDNRVVGGIVSRSDSFLVASARTSPIPRLFLTMFVLRPGSAAPESVWGAFFPNRGVKDLAWNGEVAFVADGDRGILSVVIPGASSSAVTVAGDKEVRGLDANGTRVVAVAEAGYYAQFLRSGAAGDTLIPEMTEVLPLDLQHVSIQGDVSILSAIDGVTSQQPEESGGSAVSIHALSGPGMLGPYGGTGRTRRVVWDSGYAYVADYTGGFRIYRAAEPDTSLVGALGPSGGARVVDLALDPARGLAFLASSSAGLQVVDVSNPSAPSLLGSLLLPDQASAVAAAGPGLVAVGWRGFASGGITFVDVTIPTAPTPRGEVRDPFVLDPRAIATRDTIAFIADASQGLVSVGFGDPDAPEAVGVPTQAGALDLDLQGDLLLVGTSSLGLQIVDVFNPASPVLRSTVPAPRILGVARSGNAAFLCLGAEQALVVNVANASSPVVEGPVTMPALPRDGAWVGDTLLVATGLALERLQVSPVPTPLPTLALGFDPAAMLPRVSVSWSPVSVSGMVGLNLMRDAVAPPSSATAPVGDPVNASLLDPGATSFQDESPSAGVTYRYRLVAALADGSGLEVAQGSIAIPSTPGVGRPYPNPATGSGGVTLPYRLAAGAGSGSVTLRVFDVRGRQVRSVTAPSPAGGGFGSVAWDGTDQSGALSANGVYFLKLLGPGIDDARQVVLLH